MYTIFEHTICGYAMAEGQEAAELEATVRGLVWREVGRYEAEALYTHSRYYDTHTGPEGELIDIYYDYGADYYYFVVCER
jgi:hypothetical protein